MYQDSIEAHPLREKKLKKEIVDAWVEEWQRRNRSKPSDRSLIADIISLLPSCRRTDSAGFRPRSTLRSPLTIADRGAHAVRR